MLFVGFRLDSWISYMQRRIFIVVMVMGHMVYDNFVSLFSTLLAPIKPLYRDLIITSLSTKGVVFAGMQLYL